MGSKVALVAFDENNARESFERALKLVGGISDLNTAKRSVVIKVGVFDPSAGNHTSINVADAIAGSFNSARKENPTRKAINIFKTLLACTILSWPVLFRKLSIYPQQ